MKTQTEIKRGTFNAYYQIENLKPAEINRDVAEKHAENFKSKLTEYGWLMPIVVSSIGDVIEGHHRIKAAITLGQKTLPAYIIDWVDTKDEREHLECIISLNNGNKAWSRLDYLKAFSEDNEDYKKVYNAYLSNSNNISVGNIINCYFREKSMVFKKGDSKIEDEEFGDYLVSEFSKLYNDFNSGEIAAYCVREFINIAYNKANKNIEFVDVLFLEYRKICKNSKDLATSIKSFRPYMEMVLTTFKTITKK